MSIKCLIIDDEPLAINVIKNYLNDINDIVIVETFSNAIDGINFLKDNHVDLIFLDINMPQLSGISFYKSLQKPPNVIFTTAYSEYAIEGFDLDALDYLLKPFSFDRFVKAVSKTKDLKANFKESIVIKSNKKLHQVKIEDILYLESIGDYIKVHINNSYLITYKTLKGMFEKLPKSNFKQVHKSFVINKKKLDYIEGNTVIINSNKIPLGQKFKKDFLDNFTS